MQRLWWRNMCLPHETTLPLKHMSSLSILKNTWACGVDFYFTKKPLDDWSSGLKNLYGVSLVSVKLMTLKSAICSVLRNFTDTIYCDWLIISMYGVQEAASSILVTPTITDCIIDTIIDYAVGFFMLKNTAFINDF